MQTVQNVSVVNIKSLFHLFLLLKRDRITLFISTLVYNCRKKLEIFHTIKQRLPTRWTLHSVSLPISWKLIFHAFNMKVMLTLCISIRIILKAYLAWNSIEWPLLAMIFQSLKIFCWRFAVVEIPKCNSVYILLKIFILLTFIYDIIFGL